MRDFKFPRPLRPGDLIAVVAPASPFDAALAWRGLGFLRERYRLRFDRGLFSRTGYLAGDDARREAELRGALEDPDVALVLAARGGYGASRFCHRLPWDALVTSPRWVMGFSDITALHVELNQRGIASLHAPNLTSLGVSASAFRRGFARIVEAPLDRPAFENLDVIRSGTASGPLVGGNLTLLHACAAAGRLSIPEGAVLLVEDVTERPYRIDRMLATLDTGGHFARVAAVVIGDFTDCNPGPDRVRVEHVLRERFASLGVPVVAGVPVGHGARNEAVVFGQTAIVDAQGSRGRVHFSS